MKAENNSGMPLSRRDMMMASAAGTGGLLLGAPLQAAATLTPAKAKAVIQIWMWGGPSHLDTFDPKPEAGPDYCGPYTTPIETSVNGIRIGQALPLHKPVSIRINDQGVELSNKMDDEAVLIVVMRNHALEAVRSIPGIDTELPATCRPGDSIIVDGHQLDLIEVRDG